MTGSTGSPVTTQTQTRDPWSGAQPYLNQMFSNAQQMQQGGVGYQPYTGPTVAGLDPILSEGLGGQVTLAQLQRPPVVSGIDQALDLNNKIISGYYTGQPGITPAIQGGAGNVTMAGQRYADIYNQSVGQQNPYLQSVIDAQNRIGMEKISGGMSAAGRYGSGMMQDVMARAQAETADPVLMQDYEARMNRALQANQGLAQSGMQLADIYGQGLGRAMSMEQMIGPLAQAQYEPYQAETAYGQFMQGRAQQDLQGQIAQYNAQQAYPWQQLERESAILAGAGQLGGTTVTAQTPLQAPLAQRLLGGALVGGGLGSSIGGPYGAGLGALGGGLAGAFL